MTRKILFVVFAILLGGFFALVWYLPPSPKVARIKQSNPSNIEKQPDIPQTPNSPPEAKNESRVERHLVSPVVSMRAIKDMKHAAESASPLFDNVPDDETGRRSPRFGQLKLWHKLLEKAAETGSREDLFTLVQVSASFFARDREAEPLFESLDDLRNWMEHPGPHIIRELGEVVAENNGTLDASTAALAIQVFSVRGFDNEPDWEDESKPIDSAGILIARPEILPLLEALPIDQLGFFLRAQTPEMFFRRYEEGADGMPELRQRYSENRDMLLRIFIHLTNKVDTYH